MADQLHSNHEGSGPALTGRKGTAAQSRLGGNAPAVDGQILKDGKPPPSATPGREARDTVGGCRERAAQDRLLATSASTGNRRQVFEQSAYRWDARADELQALRSVSAEQQRAADRALWEREEGAAPEASP
jgi:hypothetical protein